VSRLLLKIMEEGVKNRKVSKVRKLEFFTKFAMASQRIGGLFTKLCTKN
jgi:hypothetical protein